MTVVGGVRLIQQLLRADLVDELRIDIMPVLLGAGQRFFEGADLERLQLEKVVVQDIGARTSLRFRVVNR